MNVAKARDNRTDGKDAEQPRPGISNRESAAEESAEREANPPEDAEDIPANAERPSD
jgi:hypothetical protein